MKKVVTTILTVISILLVTSIVNAQGLKWSEEYKATDCVLTGSNTDSGNVCYGTLLEYKTATGLKAIGFGGFAGGITSEHKASVNFMGFTFFNDMLWTGVNVNTEKLKINNLKENITAVIGVSLLKFNGLVNK